MKTGLERPMRTLGDLIIIDRRRELIVNGARALMTCTSASSTVDTCRDEINRLYAYERIEFVPDPAEAPTSWCGADLPAVHARRICLEETFWGLCPRLLSPEPADSILDSAT